jgi:hypothetical protein
VQRTMKYEIFISAGKKYLVIRVHEPVTEGFLEEFLKATAEKMKESGIDNFLFDLRRAPNQTSLAAHWWAIKNLSKELGFKPDSKHALLVTPQLLADYEFVETVLYNSGYRSKRFINESEAIEWLEEEVPVTGD